MRRERSRERDEEEAKRWMRRTKEPRREWGEAKREVDRVRRCEGL